MHTLAHMPTCQLRRRRAKRRRRSIRSTRKKEMLTPPDNGRGDVRRACHVRLVGYVRRTGVEQQLGGKLAHRDSHDRAVEHIPAVAPVPSAPAVSERGGHVAPVPSIPTVLKDVGVMRRGWHIQEGVDMWRHIYHIGKVGDGAHPSASNLIDISIANTNVNAVLVVSSNLVHDLQLAEHISRTY